MARFIQLTQEQQTEVDDEDFEWLSEYRWHAAFSPSYLGGGNFRVIRNKDKTTTYMHREIIEHYTSSPLTSDVWIDHIDTNPLNNKKDNLRIVTKSQSSINRNKASNNTSGYKGVTWHEGKWEARISINGKRVHLGRFDDINAAAKAYESAAFGLHGEYARKVNKK